MSKGPVQEFADKKIAAGICGILLGSLDKVEPQSYAALRDGDTQYENRNEWSPTISLGMPVMIGEWHFGALDVGLPGSGIGRVRNQMERGRAYRVYLETAAAEPWCVGVHYFTLYDQSALGRFDGENYNIGFLDVCNKPYAPLAEAARQSHSRMYVVASGAEPPCDELVEYLPKLFL